MIGEIETRDPRRANAETVLNAVALCVVGNKSEKFLGKSNFIK